MDVSPLSDTCLPEIFSQSVSLEEQRYLVLMKFDVLIFPLSNMVSRGRSICLAQGHKDSSNAYSAVGVLHIPANFLIFSFCPLLRGVLRSPTKFCICRFFMKILSAFSSCIV